MTQTTKLSTAKVSMVNTITMCNMWHFCFNRQILEIWQNKTEHATHSCWPLEPFDTRLPLAFGRIPTISNCFLSKSQKISRENVYSCRENVMLSIRFDAICHLVCSDSKFRVFSFVSIVCGMKIGNHQPHKNVVKLLSFRLNGEENSRANWIAAREQAWEWRAEIILHNYELQRFHCARDAIERTTEFHFDK